MVDTNVLVSAILRGRIPREVIQFIIDTPDYDWMVSTEILKEYKEVLRRPKFKLTEDIIEEWWFVLDTVTKLVEVNQVIVIIIDRATLEGKQGSSIAEIT